MAKTLRWLKNKDRGLRKRISQSMRDAGRTNGKCRRLQRKPGRIERVCRALRSL